MAEHGLAGPVIGLAFDGTGYGTDGTIWGGEILICEGASFERFSHLKTIEMIGGDSSMKDGWKSAMSHRYAASRHPQAPCQPRESGNLPDCLSFEIDLAQILNYAAANDTLRDYEPQRIAVEAAIGQSINTVTTSSMGRLFDAVSSLLGIHHINRYEGECAIMLENAANDALLNPGKNEAAELALRFHKDVAGAVLVQCRDARAAYKTDIVCISGGVFQNKILTEEVLRLLRADGFTPYFNIAVPPNDGGIALGQNFIGMEHLMAKFVTL
jgi:hydrogenase maturation protein HypF